MDNPIVIVLLAASGVLFIIYLCKVLSGGSRVLLYQLIQKYGYNHATTLDALSSCMTKILVKDGYEEGYDLSIWHEVGNRYSGNFKFDGELHNLTIYTDGWQIEYQIDDNPPKKGKP